MNRCIEFLIIKNLLSIVSRGFRRFLENLSKICIFCWNFRYFWNLQCIFKIFFEKLHRVLHHRKPPRGGYRVILVYFWRFWSKICIFMKICIKMVSEKLLAWSRSHFCLTFWEEHDGEVRLAVGFTVSEIVNVKQLN